MSGRNKDIVIEYWKAFDERRFEDAKKCLHADFRAVWVTTNETFNRNTFIEMNKDYPGKWRTELQRCDDVQDGGVSIVWVYSQGDPYEFYVTTYYTFKENKIFRTKEYWSTCEKAPEWRKKYSVKEQ